MAMKVSSSKEEPRAISKNLSKSLFEDLEHPSAIFAEIEIADLNIWFVNENVSDFGKFFVNL